MFSVVGLLGVGSRIIGFLTSPLGMAVMIGLAIMYVRWDAKQEAMKACEAANLRAEVAELQRQRAASAKVAEEAQKDAEARAAEVVSLQKQVDAYDQELAARGPDAVCALNHDDAERLRTIR